MTERERIERRAYLIYEETGDPDTEKNWKLAEHEIWRENYWIKRLECTANHETQP